jgi:hypothetical protein
MIYILYFILLLVLELAYFKFADKFNIIDTFYAYNHKNRK